MLDTRSHRRTGHRATCQLKIVRYSQMYKSQGHIRGGETTRRQGFSAMESKETSKQFL